ncbi:alanine--glyoxylate aminotransferase family protein [Magnetospirillum sp. SS-4]|uniref:pyridoxal-phosphate-dependent aminotransferase family protein n=1 Tax=Magnetospirillum sp. SS-4 TaxID=2681465 RepID=UPI00137F06D6|nr:alanine--glyoxylate aminotransferase family protein [Magnetospirillum sp. SS-4]CAA7613871.1 Serine-pyruvate aminotransferase [Magnetospirillum sp. SS-4]
MKYPTPPTVVSLDEILPEEPLLMMGAGPVPIPHKVAYANSLVINHLGDTMNRVIEQVKTMARYVFQTGSGHVMGVAGPASAAMEMAIANLVEPGTRVLSICNGLFSKRLAEMAERVGGDVTRYDAPEKQGAEPEIIEGLLKTGKFRVITVVQGETSSTVWNRRLVDICRLGKRYGCLMVVDAVCTLSTMEMEMDEWGVDAIITGGQKGLSSIPGVSLIAFSEDAWRHIEKRNSPMAHWCLDARLADNFWNKHAYHYTAPVSGILALHEALRLIGEETLPGRFRRHAICSAALQGGIEAMGLELLIAPEWRLASVVGITVPDGVSADEVRHVMNSVHKVEIAGAFGLNILRIGQMGEQSRTHNIFRTLHALGTAMRVRGGKVDLPAGMAELERVLASGG